LKLHKYTPQKNSKVPYTEKPLSNKQCEHIISPGGFLSAEKGPISRKTFRNAEYFAKSAIVPQCGTTGLVN